MTKRFLIVDGNNIAARSYYVGNCFNFFSMIDKVQRRVAPHYMAIVFDDARPDWRKKLYPAYKADREESPDSLIMWLTNLRDRLEKTDVAIFTAPEADDAIFGILVSGDAEGEDLDFYIFSSDKDMYGLVDEDTKLVIPGDYDQNPMGPKEVFESLGVWPYQVPEYKALVGGHDNIPGCPLVGAKSAAVLLQEFTSIANIYEAIDGIDNLRLRNKAKIKQSLLDNKKDVELSLELSKMYPNVREFTLDECENLLDSVTVSAIIKDLARVLPQELLGEK